jgi:DNA modification methylase
MDYQEFLTEKRIKPIDAGFEPVMPINNQLFDFQIATVKRALKLGRSAIFADCGLGKTPMQLEWARHVSEYTGKPVLILAPLAVSAQTKQEGFKFGVNVNICTGSDDVQPGVNISNYEKLHRFDLSVFSGVVLDESSILKAFHGSTRNELIERCQNIPYLLACTATPSPNDHTELGNHSEFLRVMKETEMKAEFFTHDGKDTSKWRLKRHGAKDFWKWVGSWSTAFRTPDDIGFNGDTFLLPEIEYTRHVVQTPQFGTGQLFAVGVSTLNERRNARRATMDGRVAKAKEIIENDTTPGGWVVWCDLNDESSSLAKELEGSFEVRGSHKDEYKSETMLRFAQDAEMTLISKPQIAGWGMNWQNHHKIMFVGISDSYERFYQAVRRCWRFGQKDKVQVHIIISDIEMPVYENILKKEKHAKAFKVGFINEDYTGRRKAQVEDYKSIVEKGENWTAINGDSCVEIKNIPSNSIHFSIYSPPFAQLYSYSDKDRDMGNSRNYDEFFTHFKFLSDELYRVLMPGRLMSVHCMDIPAMKERDGFIGLKDFPADLRHVFEQSGFRYHSKVTIRKDPLIEATRTKAIGLMHKQIVKDSAMCRQGLPDYVLTVKKPGENKEPVAHPKGFTPDMWYGENEPKEDNNNDLPEGECNPFLYAPKRVYSHDVWRRYAEPMWDDIRQTNTLNKERGRDEKDEKHICPLQLDVINRCLALWTNPGDLVLSPFMGIGSEGYCALKQDRRFVGIELKESYFDAAISNLKSAEKTKDQLSMFGAIGIQMPRPQVHSTMEDIEDDNIDDANDTDNKSEDDDDNE